MLYEDIESPQGIGRKCRWVVAKLIHRPVFVNEGQEQIH